MKLNKELFIEINETLLNNDTLIDAVDKKLNIEIDRECSNLYDQITEKEIDVSYEDIIKSVRDVIIKVIETYI